MTNAEKFKEVFGIDFWDSLINGTLEAEWMYEEYDEDTSHDQEIYSVDVSTSNEFTYELIKELAIRNGGKIVNEQVPNNYILPISIPAEALSDFGKELLGFKKE